MIVLLVLVLLTLTAYNSTTVPPRLNITIEHTQLFSAVCLGLLQRPQGPLHGSSLYKSFI